MVQTPVGARCRQCARLRPPVVEQVPAPLFARSAAAGVGAALAVGLVWGVIPSFGFFGFLIAGGAGYLIGEAMTRTANRRRSRPLLAEIGRAHV